MSCVILLLMKDVAPFGSVKCGNSTLSDFASSFYLFSIPTVQYVLYSYNNAKQTNGKNACVYLCDVLQYLWNLNMEYYRQRMGKP